MTDDLTPRAASVSRRGGGRPARPAAVSAVAIDADGRVADVLPLTDVSCAYIQAWMDCHRDADLRVATMPGHPKPGAHVADPIPAVTR